MERNRVSDESMSDILVGFELAFDTNCEAVWLLAMVTM
jgi:hypothetical protein